MAATITEGRVVVSDGRVDPDAGRPVRLANCLPAMAIGLTAPAAVVLLVDPHALARAAYLLPGLLAPLLLVTIAIFAYCILVPGEVSAVSADAAERSLVIVEANLFARRRTIVPFRDIADVRMANGYDQDGYATPRAEIVLRDGPPVALPAWIGAAEASALGSAVKAWR